MRYLLYVVYRISDRVVMAITEDIDDAATYCTQRGIKHQTAIIPVKKKSIQKELSIHYNDLHLNAIFDIGFQVTQSEHMFLTSIIEPQQNVVRDALKDLTHIHRLYGLRKKDRKKLKDALNVLKELEEDMDANPVHVLKLEEIIALLATGDKQFEQERMALQNDYLNQLFYKED